MKKNIIIYIVSIFILTICLVLFFVYKNNNKDQAVNHIDSENNLNDTQVNKNMSCYGLDDNSKDLCLSQEALNNNNINICNSIKNEKKKIKCFDNVNFDVATDNDNLKKCMEVLSPLKQKGCFDTVMNDSNDIAVCEEIKDMEKTDDYVINYDYCVNTVNLRLAATEKNEEYCELMIDKGFKAKCLSVVNDIDLGSDLDNDGLIFSKEIYYDTDPNNPDTDGDSYLDGDEIGGGYNPNSKEVTSEFFLN